MLHNDVCSAEIAAYRNQIRELRAKLRAAEAAVEPEVVVDYRLRTPRGPRHISDLFGDHDTLFLIHNMGAHCAYCTLWADSLNGVLDHILSRAAVVMTSPDTSERQSAFAARRGWRFATASTAGTSLVEDLGYGSNSAPKPGMSVLRKEGQAILRVSCTDFGPGDDFCSIFHLWDLLPEGLADWTPKLTYDI